tara:strand:+ start:2036 stop:2623 length:588 start_codon:yes stop_codon:yes gene_type:complete
MKRFLGIIIIAISLQGFESYINKVLSKEPINFSAVVINIETGKKYQDNGPTHSMAFDYATKQCRKDNGSMKVCKHFSKITYFSDGTHQNYNFPISANISKSKIKKVEIADMISKAKDTCKSLGFKEGTDKFADCSLKLYSQNVELAAEKKQTIVMQPQSSGSNVMTIYDPVRDSNALMNKGMKMLSGGCTLGIDC